MVEPKPLPHHDVRHLEPLPLLLDWHNARGLEIEPEQNELLRELLRRLHNYQELEYERIKRDPGNRHENCAECGTAG